MCRKFSIWFESMWFPQGISNHFLWMLKQLTTSGFWICRHRWGDPQSVYFVMCLCLALSYKLNGGKKGYEVSLNDDNIYDVINCVNDRIAWASRSCHVTRKWRIRWVESLTRELLRGLQIPGGQLCSHWRGTEVISRLHFLSVFDFQFLMAVCLL